MNQMLTGWSVGQALRVIVLKSKAFPGNTTLLNNRWVKEESSREIKTWK